jgi:hypothetical protein
MAPQHEKGVGSAGVMRREGTTRGDQASAPDLRKDPAFSLDSDMWDEFRAVE